MLRAGPRFAQDDKKNEAASKFPSAFMLLSPLGERLGEGVKQQTTSGLNPLT
jgi:hypothetical protein